MAKVALVKGLSAAGVPASVERPGYSPLGEEWVADVFAQTSSGPVIFEVQLSQQHWDDYRLRTHRYAASGIRCMWLVRDTHFNAFTKARIRDRKSGGEGTGVAVRVGFVGRGIIQKKRKQRKARTR